MLPDFFLDEESPDSIKKQMKEGGDIKTSSEESGSGPAKTFKSILPFLNEGLVQTIGGVFEFNLSGEVLQTTESCYGQYDFRDSHQYCRVCVCMTVINISLILHVHQNHSSRVTNHDGMITHFEGRDQVGLEGQRSRTQHSICMCIQNNNLGNR